ncbi:MAG: hypothetical protein KJ985_12370, partial [Proteobacteria bacterium]|nr:hypothetical protein [Pseudomonadota bacterium]
MENGLFAQALRCSEQFYPRNIDYMPAVKISSAQRRAWAERPFSKVPFQLTTYHSQLTIFY